MTSPATRNANDLVTVTGASGFIATHCILALLQAGYRVRGTVRSRRRCAEIEEGLGKHCDLQGRLEFVVADLLKDEGWAEAVEGARYVLHVASPLPTAPPKNELDLITPAREGTLRVLRAASNAGVERVVLTSSLAAITSGQTRPPNRTYDENDWSDLTRPMGAYEKSKTLAERAAWDFVDALPNDKRFELVAVNPGVVLGPALIPDTSMSAEFVGKLLRNDMPGCPQINIAMVDVRDVAAAQVAAMTRAEAVGCRFVLAGKSTALREIALILKAEFGPRGYRIPTRTLPNILVRLVAHFDKAVGLVVPELGLPTHVSCKRAQDVLGLVIRDPKETIVATAESLIEYKLA